MAKALAWTSELALRTTCFFVPGSALLLGAPLEGAEARSPELLQGRGLSFPIAWQSPYNGSHQAWSD